MVNMKKVLMYLVIWLISVSTFVIVNKEISLVQAMFIVIIPCLTFWVLYFIYSHKRSKDGDVLISESGVLGGRGLGLLINMFLIEMFFELHCNFEITLFLFVIAIVTIALNRNSIKDFFTKNIWTSRYYLSYLAVELVITSIYAMIGNRFNFVLIELDGNGIRSKIIIGVMICLVFFLTEPPDSFFIRFSSMNDQWRDKKIR